MNRPLRSASSLRSLAFGLWLACGSACGHASEARGTAAPRPSPDDDCSAPQLDASLRSQPSAAVILVLRDAADSELAARQERVLRDLGDGFRVARRYGSVAALAGQLTAAGLARARVHPDVRCIQIDGPGGGTPPLSQRQPRTQLASSFAMHAMSFAQ